MKNTPTKTIKSETKAAFAALEQSLEYYVPQPVVANNTPYYDDAPYAQ